MARARAQFFADRVDREGLGTGHGPDEVMDMTGPGLKRHVDGAVGEMATAKWHDRYFDGGQDNWGGADVCGYHVRATRHTNGYLSIFKRDPDDGLFLLVTLRRLRDGSAVCVFPGWIVAREGKRDEWFITCEANPELLRPGSEDQWGVPQHALTALTRSAAQVSL